MIKLIKNLSSIYVQHFVSLPEKVPHKKQHKKDLITYSAC
jgi:hypothetical protein